jgi:geranylgeranyl pyrophosphate synthase
MSDIQGPIITDAPPEDLISRISVRLEHDLSRVRHRLSSLVEPPDKKVRSPLMYAVENTGRLFRPTLVLVSSYLVEREPNAGTSQDIIDAAAAVELLHIATLCHDDLIDDAATRRGIPTASVKYGNSIALLTGDYLLARCMQVAASLGNEHTLLVSETLAQACIGQILETSQLYDPVRSEADYLSAISGKTAYLMRTCTSLGAMQRGASREAQDALASFGHNLGMAFQIWDDVLDFSGRDGADKTGKEPAKDLINGVYTLPVIYVMGDLPGHLVQALGQPPLSVEQRQDILAILHELGAIDRAADLARRHIADAIQAVKAHPSFEARAPLVERCLLGLVGRLAPKHPALQMMATTPGAEGSADHDGRLMSGANVATASGADE